MVYLCLAPKSNSVYTAYGAVQEEIEHTRQEPVPLHLRNAPTRLMKELGLRARATDTRTTKKTASPTWIACPSRSRDAAYYQPTQEGREKLLAQRMEEIRRIRTGKRNRE